MSDANRFGRIVTPLEVERALKFTVEDWIGDYLGEMERLLGYDADEIARPQAIVDSVEFDKMPEDALPCILVMNAGLAGPPERRSDGRNRVTWSVGVAPVVAADGMSHTRILSYAYSTAIRALVLQHKALRSQTRMVDGREEGYPDGFASGLRWTDENYGDIPFLESRTMASGRIVFAVGVDDVVTEHAGPRVPSPKPSEDPGPWPLAQRPTITVHPVALAEALS